MNDFSAFDDSLNGALAVVGNTVNYAERNKGVQPIFFIASLPDAAATAKHGTLRMYDQETVRIHTAGDTNSAATHPVNDAIKERFAVEYAAWKATRSNDHIVGMPLTEWALVTKGFVEELKALHIRSVEDLSVVPDTAVSKIQDGRAWREKAKAWLATNHDAGQAAKYAAENEQLRADMDAMRAEMKRLSDRLDTDEPEGVERRGPGRPRKAA